MSVDDLGDQRVIRPLLAWQAMEDGRVLVGAGDADTPIVHVLDGVASDLWHATRAPSTIRDLAGATPTCAGLEELLAFVDHMVEIGLLKIVGGLR